MHLIIDLPLSSTSDQMVIYGMDQSSPLSTKINVKFIFLIKYFLN